VKDTLSPFNSEQQLNAPLDLGLSRAPTLHLNFADDIALKIREAQAAPSGENQSWSWQQTCDGSGVRFDFKEEFGRGFSELVDLGGGVYARVRNSIHTQPFSVWSRHEADVIFTILLSGGVRMMTPDHVGAWIWAPAAMSGFNPEVTMQYSEVAANVDIHLVTIVFRDVAALSRFGLPPSRVSTAFLSQLAMDESNAALSFCEPQPDALRAAQEIIDCPYDGALRTLYISGKVRELVCHIISGRVIGENFDSWSADSRIDGRTVAQLVKARIEMDLSRPVSGDELASDIGVSRNTLMKAFKQEFGTTIGQYSQEIRLQYASKMLLETTLPITEVALTIGYDKPGSFTEAFRQRFQQTPRDFRASSRPA